MVTLQFLITSFIVVLIPGTGVVFTVSTGIAQGKKASIFASTGCTAGIIPHLLATVLGLAAILHASAVAFQTLKYAGAAYLFYLAYVTWKDKSAFVINENQKSLNPYKMMWRGVLLNILNPKLTIFFLAFLPQFVDSNAASPLGQLLLLSGIFMLMTFAVFVVYGFLAHAFRKVVIESPRVQAWLRKSFAATFAGLGMNLAFSER